jgi:hypothetical protein
MATPNRLRTTPQVARELGVPVWTIEHAIRDEQVEQPPHIGGVRAWGDDDVARLRKALDARAARVAARRASAEARA